ncbi:MAG: host specificity protein [Chloroflexi bacterium]|nr:host specificity protein [Chloroflexota bacterium]
MTKNKTKIKLQQNPPVFGVISSSNDPLVAEIIGHCGYDYFMVDGEHGLINPAQATHIVRACEAVSITPLIRIGSKDPKLVLPFMDAGFMGVMMPGLETAVDITLLVNAIKYPPIGKRGLGPARVANYMLTTGEEQAAYVRFANEQTLVLPQFEDIVLLDTLPELVRVPGVDGFVIGPRDLSLSMGFADGANHPEVQAVIDQAIGIIREAGLAVGITAGTAVAAQAQIDRGATIILNSLPNLIKQSSAMFLGTAVSASY